jgi:hypothetical protein
MSSGIVFTGNEGGHLQHERVERDARDRCAVAEEVELEIIVERRVAGIGKTGRQQRVAIGCGIQDVLGGDIGAGARPVLDNDLLAKPLRQRRLQ